MGGATAPKQIEREEEATVSSKQRLKRFAWFSLQTTTERLRAFFHGRCCYALRRTGTSTHGPCCAAANLVGPLECDRQSVQSPSKFCPPLPR